MSDAKRARAKKRGLTRREFIAATSCVAVSTATKSLASEPGGRSGVERRVQGGAAGAQTADPPNTKRPDLLNDEDKSDCLKTSRRKRIAGDIREEAAEKALRPGVDQLRNDDLERLGPYTQFTKTLRHYRADGSPTTSGLPRGRPGDVEPAAFKAFQTALNARTFEAVEQYGATFSARPDDEQRVRLSNPVGGLAYDLEGFDTHVVKQRPAPAYDSAETTAEMAELYWMAILRDTPFDTTAFVTNLQRAVSDLTSNYSFYRGVRGLTERTAFRAYFIRRDSTNADKAVEIVPFPGVDIGPHVSQFLLRGNREMIPGCTPVDETAGLVRVGTLRVSQRQRTVLPGLASDFMRTEAAWFDVQNGANTRGMDRFDCELKYIRTPRDGANYVHFDKIYQQYYIAACLLLNVVPSNFQGLRIRALSQTGAEQGETRIFDQTADRQIQTEALPADAEVLNIGNPYRWASTRDAGYQAGFATFGVTHITTLLAEVSTRAHKAVWLQKWHVHRRLRPEEFGGHIQFRLRTTTPADYAISPELVGPVGTTQPSAVLREAAAKFGSYLLPQTFPEGSPVHPAYGAGHATLAGACVTVLKALFNEEYRFSQAVRVADPATGRRLEFAPEFSIRPGEDDCPRCLTVGNELNKLASNSSFFRAMAGVHWRSDNTESLLLGEQIAIELLCEQTQPSDDNCSFYREVHPRNSPYAGRRTFFRLTRFDGVKIEIADGDVKPL